MNIELFNALMKEGQPMQNPWEWKLFLEFIEGYFKNRDIENPVIVELGTYQNRQKKFYEQLLSARHIGIDKNGYSDIQGDIHKRETLEMLKKMLNGKKINLLFIDALHFYEDAKLEYEIYGLLTKNIIVFHDIDTYPKQNNRIGRFWKEISKQYPCITFNMWQDGVQYGIGLLIKE